MVLKQRESNLNLIGVGLVCLDMWPGWCTRKKVLSVVSLGGGGRPCLVILCTLSTTHSLQKMHEIFYEVS